MMTVMKLIFFSLVTLILISPQLHCDDTSERDDTLKGIDVSAWQDMINWDEVYADNIQFVFCKATEGVGWTDPFFETNINNATTTGMYCGAYHFATPQSNDAVNEAMYFLSSIEEYLVDGYLRPVLDLEQGSYLGITALSNWVHTWMNTIVNQTGIEPIIYVNSNYASNYLDESINQYDLWIAHWTYDANVTPNIGIWEDWHFWQYSDQGLIDGISGYVDLNLFNGNVTDLQNFIISSSDPFLDINQSFYNRGFPIRHAIDGDWAAAQNFTPTVNTITYVSVYLRKFGTPEFDLTIELRENHPEGTLIDSLVFSPGEIPTSWEWFEVDFVNTTVTPGVEYFVVLPPAPSGVTTSFGYEWGYAYGDQYADGAFWFTRDGGGLWRDLPLMYDFCFQTYGHS